MAEQITVEVREGQSSTEEITFEQICELEPRVGSLYLEAQAIMDSPMEPRFCANELWYAPGGLKSRLYSLVGYHAELEVLHSQYAYEIAYWSIYHALPECRNCGCLAVEPKADVGLT